MPQSIWSMLLSLCRGDTRVGETVDLDGTCFPQATSPSSVPIAQRQATFLPQDTVQCVSTSPCSHCSLDTYGIYHLGGPERTLFLLCQGHVLRPRSGRAGEDRAVCGGQRSSLPRRTGRWKDFFGRGRILVLVDGVPKIGSDLLCLTSFSLC